MTGGLLSLAEAQGRLLALAPVLPVEERPVQQARGFYLPADVAALVSRPAAATSAMDGYAVRAADGAGPWRVIGESAAGHPFCAPVTAGEAVRIATGALLPPGADTVVIQEGCRRDAERLELSAGMPQMGANVREHGSDFAIGERLLAAGSAVSPASVALLLAGGHVRVPVRQRPSIAIMDSGDELAPAETPLGLGQVTASNAAMLASMLAGLPCTINLSGPVPDRLDQVAAALDACGEADIVVTTGGASVGDHDLIRPALAAVGARLDFWKVAIKPGKPLLVAERHIAGRRQLILGLPGNPASAFVTAWLFLLPLVRAALGADAPLPPTIPSRLAGSVPATGGRAEFLRGRWDGTSVAPLPTQDSGALRTLAAANALILRPAHAPAEPVGAEVLIHWLENGGFA